MTEMFRVMASEGCVDGWASRRLPFEPRGVMVDYRAALRAAVARLEPIDGQLYAAYSSPAVGPCDVENVLLYDLGLSAFSRALTKLVVERFFELTSRGPDDAADWSHHHHYSSEDVSSTIDWGVVATWPVTPIVLPLRVEQVWFALHNTVRVAQQGACLGDRLSIELVVERPPTSTSPSLLSLMKVLVDGAVSSLHAHDGARLEDIVSRLAARLGENSERVAECLTTSSTAVLGTRHLLWPYRDFVQWNPADDQLVRVSLESRDAEAWSIGGRLRSCSPHEDDRTLIGTQL